jgi:TolB protein
MNSSVFEKGLLVLLLASFLGCGNGTTPPELKDKILYLSDEGICTINPDGTDRKVIVPSDKGGPFSNPKWSPDKRKIAFTGRVEGNARIMLVNSDGSHRKVIGLPGGVKKRPKRGEPYVVRVYYDLEFLGWSTSGKYVLYRYGPIFDASIFGVISTKGKVIAQLGGSYPSFGGEDNLVYVVHYGDIITLKEDIFSYDLRKREKKNLTNSKGDTLILYRALLSPDGKMIVFKSSGPFTSELWVMHSDGLGKKKLITPGKEFQGVVLWSLSFSPDGKKIMLIADQGDRSQIYAINTDGTGLRPITDKIVLATAGASWSPDGKRIVFTSDKDGNYELYIANIDGIGLKRLTNNSIMDCCPDW